MKTYMERKIAIGIVSAILILSIGYGSLKLFGKKKDIPKKEHKEFIPTVLVSEVKYQTIKTNVQANGRLVASREIDIIAEANGKIQHGSIELKEGTRFNRGDVICSIYKDEAELSLKAQKSQFLNLIASILPDIKIDYKTSFEAFQKYFDSIEIDKPLPKLPGYGNQLKIFLASRNVLSQYYSIKQMELAVARYTIYAPFNGSIKTVHMQEGAFANTGARIARIVSDETLELEVPVDNANSKWVQKGQNVTVTSPDRELTWTGKINRISNYVDEKTQARSVFVGLKKDKNLLLGEYLTANFAGSVVTNAMEIPRKAIFNHDNVYVVVNDSLVKKQVNVLKQNNSTVLINGLPELTLLVVEALVNAKENIAVHTEFQD